MNKTSTSSCPHGAGCLINAYDPFTVASTKNTLGFRVRARFGSPARDCNLGMSFYLSVPLFSQLSSGEEQAWPRYAVNPKNTIWVTQLDFSVCLFVTSDFLAWVAKQQIFTEHPLHLMEKYVSQDRGHKRPTVIRLRTWLSPFLGKPGLYRTLVPRERKGQILL